jgi:hypothetical protein
MLWQDLAIMMLNILFAYSIFHQVWHGFREKKGLLALPTSIISSAGLYMMALVFWSLGFFLSAIISVYNATMWIILLIQGIIYKKG